MKRLILLALLATTTHVATWAQTNEIKINLPAAAVAIFNPSLEAGLSNINGAVVMDVVGIFASEDYMGTGYPLAVAMGTVGYRHYLGEQRQEGWFAGMDSGVFAYRMNKNVVPLVVNDHRKDSYDVGYGYLIGFSAGYKYRLTHRLSAEAKVSYGWQWSMHEGYYANGTINYTLNPTAEWTPYGGGIYLTYRL